jgi:cation:H+ antiporter
MVCYVGGMVIVYKYEKGSVEVVDEDSSGDSMTKRQAITGFIFSSVLVFLSAILLSYSCDSISKLKISGIELGGTFVGTLFMAFTTSLPEVVVSISAIRLGRGDMALGNLFGSNLFNLAILSFSDGFYRLGRVSSSEVIVSDVFTLSHTNHIITGLIGIIFIAIVLSSLMLRSKRKYGPLGVDTLSIGVLYILSLYLLFILR